jgi:quercetin dioxygenase-like cupin family protein
MSDPWRTVHNPLIKDTATFLRTSEETGGECTELEIDLAPGGGNPLHFHRSYSERFEVLEGALGVQVGRTKRTLSPGEYALVEANVPHRFFNPTPEPVRFRVELRPGHTGFENAIRILYGLARDGQTNSKGIPRNPSHIAVAGEISDMGLAGVLRLLGPLWRLLAQRARANGTEQALIAAYCSPPSDIRVSGSSN